MWTVENALNINGLCAGKVKMGFIVSFLAHISRQEEEAAAAAATIIITQETMKNVLFFSTQLWLAKVVESSNKFKHVMF